jgi:hypothetical protein
MRWFVAFLLVGALAALSASAEPWGCCAPPVGRCFDSAAYDTQVAFAEACEGAGTQEHDAIILGASTASTCNPFTECQIGCCCAGPQALDRYVINSNEELLRITFAACSAKTGFDPHQLPAGRSCVSVCGGTAPNGSGGGGAQNHTIRGTVVNGTGGNALQNAQVFIPIMGSEISARTDSEGKFTLPNVPPITTRIFAVHSACQPGQSEPVTVNRDITGVSIALACVREACAHAPPAFSSPPAVVRGTSNVQFSLTLTNACRDFVRFEPQRCDANFANCLTLTPTDLPTITDTGLAPQTAYCYKVAARWRDGTASLTDAGTGSCITTGDVACSSGGNRTQWCGTTGGGPSNGTRSAIISCDSANHATATPCGDRLVCTARPGAAPACEAAPSCEKCNGLLGLFSRLLASLEIPLGIFTSTCSEACVLNSEQSGNPLLVDTYGACLAIGSCTGYRSPDACGQDKCRIGNCTWTSVNAELGQGVCAARNASACEQCGALFGYCTRQMCDALGASPSGQQCYFDAVRNRLNGTQGCIGKPSVACRYYDTAQDCVGLSGRNAVFNIQYTGDVRTGGTNQRTVSSQDRLGIGACSWVSATGICVKNADMRGGVEDDCVESGRIYSDPRCVQDSAPPVTAFLLVSNATYSRAAVRTLPYRVTDDRTQIDDIRTFVCFSSSRSPCAYPTQTLSSVPLPEEGQWTLRFYSMDANANSEIVKEIPIRIRDGGQPAVTSVTVEESST